MSPHLLVVDDEPNIVELLSASLRFAGYDVTTATHGAEALRKAREVEPDLVVLDVMMPGLDGVGVVRRLRAAGVDVPVCILSARDEVQDRVAGLQAGADDYLVKPFALAELTARLHALLRRRGSAPSGPLVVGDLVVDPRRRVATARRARSRAHAARVRPAGGVRPPSRPRTVARAAAGSGVGLCGRRRDERGRRVRGLRAPQARGRRRAADAAHRARGGLGPASMRPPASLRARITLAALAAVALSGVLAGTLLVAAVERDGRESVDRDLRQRVAQVSEPRRPRFDPRGPRGGGGRGGQALLAGAGTFAQVAYQGRVIDQGGDVPENPPPVPAADGFATVRIGDGEWRSLTVPVGSGGAARLQLLSSLGPVQERAASLRRLVLLIGLVALAATALAAWGFTSLAVRPLHRLRAGAARVSGADDLGTPLPEDEGPVEVRSLARALNEMLARLQASTAAMGRALEATRRFAADAGHELRTPLTGLRANLDTLARNPRLPVSERQALVAGIAAEQERIVHLLDGLQALARGEAAESLPREDVELADLVDAALYAARRRHPDVAFELAEGLGEATLRGWAGGLRLLVDNLLDNAALHGRSHGRVRVGLDRNGDDLLLRVQDDGHGIPAAERESLLAPFARGSGASADGTGLGLAIVAQQVALHGGELMLEDAALGGLAVHVRLPAAA
jgi:two-component system, OmpR family, sensor histidine kinase PrrB